MKKISQILTSASLALVSLTAYTACDGGASSDGVSESSLSGSVPRGLDLAEITANPAATPGFPFSLEPGETIDFSAPNTVTIDGIDIPLNEAFVDHVQLGTWTVDSSRLLRQNSGTTGTLYFPIAENTFTNFYSTLEPSSSPSTVSTETTAFIEYTFNHRINSRILDFNPRVNEVYNSSNEPGSLQDTVTTGGRVAAANKVIVDSLASIGIAAVDHPTIGLAARAFRTMRLTDINTTNADLTGPNPVISGTYEVIDIWSNIVLDDTEAPVTLEHEHSSSGAHLSTTTILEVSTGTFTINLNAL